MSESHFSWELWAKSVPDLPASARLVLRELAFLADAEGVALASVKHLQQATGRSVRGVYAALKTLEERGVCLREQRFDECGRQLNSVYYLRSSGVDDVERAEALLGSPVVSSGWFGIGVDVVANMPGVDGEAFDRLVDEIGDGADVSDRVFREVLKLAERTAWSGDVRELVGKVLSAQAGQRFNGARNVVISLGYGSQEALVEVTSLAWKIVLSQTQALMNAKSPWSYLAQALCRSVASNVLVNVEEAMDESGIELASLSAGVGADGVQKKTRSGVVKEERVVVSLESLSVEHHQLIEALRVRGMSETIATAVTLRILEIAVRHDVSRRVCAARGDMRLSSFGVPPEAAAVWMSCVARTRTKELADVEKSADKIVGLMFNHRSVA